MTHEELEQHRVAGMNVEVGIVVQGAARVTNPNPFDSADGQHLNARDRDMRGDPSLDQAMTEDAVVQDGTDVGDISDVVQFADAGSVHNGAAPASSWTT